MTSEEKSYLLYAEAMKLNPSAIVELYELDARNLGEPDILRFHNGTNGLRESVSFQGNVYIPLPIHVKGIEITATERQPRPTLTISNIGRFMSMLMLQRDDLVGATFTRRRTFARYLDGQPGAAPVEYDPDIYFVERKLHETRISVELELSNALDLDGTMFPLRQVMSAHCSHDFYRGPGCDFAQNMVVTDANNVLFAGADRFYGQWSPQISYVSGDSVGFYRDSHYKIFVMASAGPLTGDANSPSANPSAWTEVQRYRGIYSASLADWQKNDTVYVVRNDVRTMAILFIQPGLGEEVPAPPDIRYWKLDQCARFMGACRSRFDPRNIGNPLPYGGMPGVLSLPET